MPASFLTGGIKRRMLKLIKPKIREVFMKDIDLVYFSPTGNTRKTLQTIAAGAQTQVIEHDRTYPQSRKEKLHHKDSFVIFGCPVYAGRIPSKPENIFEGIEGDDTPLSWL